MITKNDLEEFRKKCVEELDSLENEKQADIEANAVKVANFKAELDAQTKEKYCLKTAEIGGKIKALDSLIAKAPNTETELEAEEGPKMIDLS